MIGDPGRPARKVGQTNGRSERLTLSALANRLADRPWALAVASFAVTVILIQPAYIGLA
ncbi:hypothetical protein [Sphingomonas arenae]|uniref:hypothetical protein n=1 Tax=Sphingomonas arenae TaxID=2812555 RepID=UPI001967B7BC|nr:hypothetical protein [Sphingomonas arenae]